MARSVKHVHASVEHAEAPNHHSFYAQVRLDSNRNEATETNVAM